MNRTELETCIEEFYSVRGEQARMKYPGNTVFRHRGNQKWFQKLSRVRFSTAR